MDLYLYCVRRCAPSPFFCKGIGGKERVFAIPYKNLDIVVSAMSRKVLKDEDIEEKANDMKWIRDNAVLHEAVLEEAMGLGKGREESARPAIPFKFGTIFRSKRNMLDSLAPRYGEFLRTLDELEGKQEWHLKVYLADSKSLEKAIRRKSEKIQVKEKEARSINEGAAYFVQLAIAKDTEQEKKSFLDGLGEYIFETLNSYAEDATRGKILAKELTEMSEPMIFNGTFLLRDVKIAQYKKTVERLMEKFPQFYFVYSGPWPPYNFV